jgi:modulator of FtsH protease
MDLHVQPLPQGGMHVRAVPMQQPQPQYGANPAYGQPPQQQQSFGQQQQGFGGYGAAPTFAPTQPSYAAVPTGGGFGNAAAAETQGMAPARVRYLRKVYGLLAISAVFAFAAGGLAVTVGEVAIPLDSGGSITVPIIPALMLQSNSLMWIMFGLLFAGTFVASAVSKVPVLNVVALFGVSALMGLELAPMVWVAQYMASEGASMSAAPVRDTTMMVGGIFVGLTGYVFVTKKDFSYLKATLSMGFWVVFVCCILAGFLHSEVFSLAIASAGAVLSIGFLLYQTNYIFKRSNMDDPVGDALGLLVQLRNLFMFLLRIFMSRR